MIGYTDIGGPGDFSVVTYTVVRESKMSASYNHDADVGGFDMWHIGVGGRHHYPQYR